MSNKTTGKKKFWTSVKLVATDIKGVSHSVGLTEDKEGSLNRQIFAMPEKSDLDLLSSRKGIYLSRTGVRAPKAK